MRSFSDAQTLSDSRTKEQERYSDGQARPGAVGVRGEGDLCGTWSVRVLIIIIIIIGYIFATIISKTSQTRLRT